MADIYVQVYFREWRKFRAYSQEEVAKKLNVKRQTVSRIESAQADFTFSYLIMFSNLVKCRHYTDPIVRPPDVIGYQDEDFSFVDPMRVRELREQLEHDDAD